VWHTSQQHAIVCHTGVAVTFKEKLHIVRQRNWLARCHEQEAILLQEMDKYAAYYRRMQERCQDAISSLQHEDCSTLTAPFVSSASELNAKYLHGWAALLSQQAEYASSQLAKATEFLFCTASKFVVGTHWRPAQPIASSQSLAGPMASHPPGISGLMGGVLQPAQPCPKLPHGLDRSFEWKNNSCAPDAVFTVAALALKPRLLDEQLERTLVGKVVAKMREACFSEHHLGKATIASFQSSLIGAHEAGSSWKAGEFIGLSALWSTLQQPFKYQIEYRCPGVKCNSPVHARTVEQVSIEVTFQRVAEAILTVSTVGGKGCAVFDVALAIQHEITRQSGLRRCDCRVLKQVTLTLAEDSMPGCLMVEFYRAEFTHQALQVPVSLLKQEWQAEVPDHAHISCAPDVEKAKSITVLGKHYELAAIIMRNADHYWCYLKLLWEEHFLWVRYDGMDDRGRFVPVADGRVPAIQDDPASVMAFFYLMTE
jgi:hypothetical protein